MAALARFQLNSVLKQSEASTAVGTNRLPGLADCGAVTVKDGKKYYTVKKGDTWSSITKKLYGNKISYKELMQMNHKTNEKDLSIDEELLVK